MLPALLEIQQNGALLLGMDEDKMHYAIVPYYHASLLATGHFGELLPRSVPCCVTIRSLTFVCVAVGPSGLPGRQGPQELPVDPGPLPVHETHNLPKPFRNPAGCQTNGRDGMCGLVFTVIMLWFQVRVGNSPT